MYTCRPLNYPLSVQLTHLIIQRHIHTVSYNTYIYSTSIDETVVTHTIEKTKSQIPQI